MAFDAFYKDADDKHVAKYVLYGKTSDTNLYADADCTDKASVTTDVAMHALQQGALICYDEVYYTPTKFSVSLDKASVTIPAGASGADVTLTSQLNPTEDSEDE